MRARSEITGKSVDMIRMIRRSRRCGLFGLIGAVPVIGLGLAWQALRLYSQVSAEMGEDWRPPRLYVYWIIALSFMAAFNGLFGFLGAFSVFGIFVGLQTWHLWRSFPETNGPIWNPGRRHMRWGITFAYAGYLGSWSLIGLVLIHASGGAFSGL